MGYFDLESRKVNAIENPFGPKVMGCDRKSVKYMLGTKCKPCVR